MRNYLKTLPYLLLMFSLSGMAQKTSFFDGQKKYSTVRTAIAEKEGAIEKTLLQHKIYLPSAHILMTVCKNEDKLHLYAKNKTDQSYILIKSYPICSKSGTLGPKRKQGDYQVPEGFYYVDAYNPASSYFLSMRVSYPNQSDRLKSSAGNLGGNICIHGSCVTIGCVPLTDEGIKEVYLYAIHARKNGQANIPVYIYPYEMNEANTAAFAEANEGNKELLDFWANLKIGYDLFNKNKIELKIKVDAKGNYVF